ncbi:hypothetical protein VUR80DRAFT_5126 [Thermomyces stellatus]
MYSSAPTASASPSIERTDAIAEILRAPPLPPGLSLPQCSKTVMHKQQSPIKTPVPMFPFLVFEDPKPCPDIPNMKAGPIMMVEIKETNRSKRSHRAFGPEATVFFRGRPRCGSIAERDRSNWEWSPARHRVRTKTSQATPYATSIVSRLGRPSVGIPES